MDNETFFRQHAQVAWGYVRWLKFLLNEQDISTVPDVNCLCNPSNINQEILDELDALAKGSTVTLKPNKASPLVN